MIYCFIALLIEFGICAVIGMPGVEDLTKYVVVEQVTLPVILLIINSIITVFCLYKQTKNQKVNFILVFSFLFRVLLLLWDVFARDIFVLPNAEADATSYPKVAASFAFGARVDLVDFKSYPFYVGQLYKLIGWQRITAQYINVFLAIVSICIIYKILTMLEVKESTIETSMLFACFLPNSIIITSIFLQESIIAFLLICSLYFYTKWWLNRRTIHFVLSVVISILNAQLHFGGMVTAIGFVVTFFLVSNKKRKLSFSPEKIVAVVVMMFVALALISNFGDSFNKVGEKLSADSITNDISYKEYGGSGYNVGITGLPPWLGLIVNTPIRLIYFVFSPLPWEWRGLSDVFAFFGSVLFYIFVLVLMYRAYKNSRFALRDDSIKSYLFVLLMVLLVASVMFGWGVANAGTALRHREKFTYLFIIAFAVSLEIPYRKEVENEQKNIRYSTCL